MSDTFERLKAALADRYAIKEELGSGGMATVYLAEDLKHHRNVAVKVLRPELAAVVGAERFLKEIQVTANLQHPHILALFDSGEADSFLYYVMPSVQGESLRTLLDREKQLPIEDAVRITTEVASALDYAHRHEVIHRDIKPENILLHDQQSMVADFGIALAVSAAGGTRLTETGLSLGTPHYMSPEQATGDRQLDAKSDIYSLGCVAYEMLTGDPPHTGSTAQAILAKVITDKPQLITALRDTVPQHLAGAVHKALAKLPADRYATAHDFADAVTTGTVPRQALTALSMEQRLGQALQGPRPRGVPWRALAIAFGIAAVVTTVAAAWGWLRPVPEPPGELARFVVTRPASERLVLSVTGVNIAFSPDGSRFVYLGQGPNRRQLFVRAINDLEARPIAGTEGASQVFFSPGGEWVGFYSDGELRRVATEGGPPLPITQTGLILGASWGPDDVIVFSSSGGRGLMKVSASGGAPEPITFPDTTAGEMEHRWPEILPGGNAVVFTSWFGDIATARLAVVSLESGSVVRLPVAGTDPHYTDTGHLVYARSDGSVVAVPFDLERLTTTGEPVALLEDVTVKGTGSMELGVSRNGSLVYLPGSGGQDRTLVMVDRRGVESPLTAQFRAFEAPRFSPNGESIVVHVAGQIWVYDVNDSTLSPRTFEGANRYPTWSRDGARLIFSSDRNISRRLYAMPADGSSLPELVFEGRHDIWESAWSSDGRWVAIRQTAPATGRDILVVPLDGDDRTPRPFAQTSFNERKIALSPNGRWLAYVSDASGRDEVYVRAFPEPAGVVSVSVDGGTDPAWSPDGRELFYRTANQMMAAAVRTDPAFDVTERKALFRDSYARTENYTSYDVDPHGGGFLMIKGAEGPAHIVVVLNWFEELRRRMGA